MPFTCEYCPTSSADFKETISHLITDHHDREIKIKRMLRALSFKIVPEMCREHGREISIWCSHLGLTVVSYINAVQNRVMRFFLRYRKIYSNGSSVWKHGMGASNSKTVEMYFVSLG